MNLTVAIITRDEKDNIGKCIDAAKKYGFEVVVCDSGSVDGTRDIAAQKADAIYDFEWKDDFSLAKNFCASKASNEYILFIDSDEFLQEFDKDELLKMVESHPEDLGRIKIINKLCGESTHAETEWISRIYSKEKFEYEGRIHEQLVRKDGKPFNRYETNVSCYHTGYALEGEKRKQKADRNIALLKKSMEEKGENLYDIYQLGKAYYFKKDYENATKTFEKTFDFEINPREEFVLDLFVCYGYSLINSGRAKDALVLESVMDEFGHSADFLFVLGLAYMQNAKFDKAIFCLYEATKIKTALVEGANSYLANYNIGVIYECLGDVDKAKNYYEKCGEYDKAKKRLGVL